MKSCSYCGKQNEDSAVHCHECGTTEFSQPPAPPIAVPPIAYLPASEAPPVIPLKSQHATNARKFVFMSPTPKEMTMDLVTLLRCGSLLEADLIAAQLTAAGIPAFIPDQFLMQTIGFNLNTYGYVRVQVPPEKFEDAKEFLSATA
jgi:hypothetical protein